MLRHSKTASRDFEVLRYRKGGFLQFNGYRLWLPEGWRVESSENGEASMDNRCAVGFKPILKNHFGIGYLESHPWPVIGLWPNGSIAYVNPAWEQVAAENCGHAVISEFWGLGSHYLDAVPDVLKRFYKEFLDSSPAISAAPLRPEYHEYECSSALLYRRFVMQVFALRRNSWKLIIHSLLVEYPHNIALRAPHAPEPNSYMSKDGLVRQCAHCRRIKHCAVPDRWDWVPAWVDGSPSFISPGLCPLCYRFYYPKAKAIVPIIDAPTTTSDKPREST